MDEMLNKFGIKRETLNAEEIATLDKWAKALSVQQLHIGDVKNHVSAMIESLEKELHGYDGPPMTFANLFFRKRRERHMAARLQNYILLRDFLTAPEKARSYVEKQISSFKA